MSTVLVVDDAKAMRDFVQFTLAGFSGISVEEAHDGAEALRMLRQQRFDLVLLDLYLPVFDGIKLLGMKADVPLNRDTPVIVITSEDRPENKSRALDLGAYAVLLKPFYASTIMGMVREALSLPTVQPPSDDLRRAERLRIPVEISFGDDPSLICTSWDVSPYGAFVANESPPLGTLVTLTMALPTGTIDVEAEIVHTRTHPIGPLPAGFGCKFVDEPDVIRKLLQAFTSPDDE